MYFYRTSFKLYDNCIPLLSIIFYCHLNLLELHIENKGCTLHSTENKNKHRSCSEEIQLLFGSQSALVNQTTRWILDPDHLQVWQHAGHTWSLPRGQFEACVFEKWVLSRSFSISLVAQKASKTSNNHWIIFTTLSYWWLQFPVSQKSESSY